MPAPLELATAWRYRSHIAPDTRTACTARVAIAVKFTRHGSSTLILLSVGGKGPVCHRATRRWETNADTNRI